MRGETLGQLIGHERIGAYEVMRVIGHGEIASVYECLHTSLGRRAAVKILHPHLVHDQDALARFVREGRELSRISHPNVVEVFDFGELGGVPYLVMALIEGDDLEGYFRQHHPLSVAGVADCVLPVVAAVAAAHNAGVVYRDVKPTNVRLACDHRGLLVPKVIDFGISKLTGDEHGGKLQEIDELLGTASYMSPEQLRSSRLATVRSDVYSLGVILYQASTGRRPFQGDSAGDLMHAILTARVEPPSEFRPDIPPEFDRVVLRAMHRQAPERFLSARELGCALAPFASDTAAWLGEFASRSSPRIVTVKTPVQLGRRAGR